MTSTLVNDCVYPSDFYGVMEAQRAEIPRMSRDKFSPIFIVNTLRDKLEAIEKKMKNSPHNLVAEESEEWSEDTILEENPSVEIYLIESKEGRAYIKQLLAFAVLLKNTPGIGLDHLEFPRLYCREVECPPLQLIWYFSNKFKLLGINAYLMKLKSEAQIKHLDHQLVSFCFSPCLFDDRTKRKGTQILQDLLHEIIIAAHCNPESNEPLKKLRKLANEILIKITTRLISPDSSTCSFMNRQFILAILQGVPLVDSVKKRYFAHHLNYILCIDKSQKSLQEMLQQQEQFAEPFETQHQGKAETITVLIGEPQATPEVIEAITTSLKNIEAVNWETLLLTISVWEQNESTPSSKLMFSELKTVIKNLLERGLSEDKEDCIMAAFMLARHSCLISPLKFSRYEEWYSEMFAREKTSPANCCTTFELLCKVLTSWVPFEPPCFLRVHATYWPFIPFARSGMRALWSDYVTLCKARISEYTEIEQAMQYEPRTDNPVLHDIDMVIRSFETTNKLPDAISEMLLFRKDYYLDQFLPALLKKPHGIVLTDSRLRLIEVLHTAGKVPPESYSAYKAAAK